MKLLLKIIRKILRKIFRITKRLYRKFFKFHQLATMEITTIIGCPMRCKYCPQDKLINAYKKRSHVSRMTFETFKKCLDKIPKKVRIDFSGMAEPWLNPECTKMLLYAHKKGFKIAVYTTLVGMKLSDINLIKNIPFKIFNIHLPDKEGFAGIKITDNYLKKLKEIKRSNIQNLSYMSMRTVPDKIKKIIGFTPQPSLMRSRAGNLKKSDNLDFITTKRKRGTIKCRWSGNKFNQNVLLPNGDVLLCCMDYSMKHVLGNLLKINYKQLFHSKEFYKLQRGLRDESIDILCRYCTRVQEIKK